MTPVRLQATIISQYANSPVLLALIQSLNDALDPAALITQFATLVYDLNTATGYGLDVLGRIVGVKRSLFVESPTYFGFKEATTGSAAPFNQGVFYTGGATSGAYDLSDAGLRLLIMAKAAANLSDGSSKSLNAILRMLFPGRGNCYVVDGRDQTMTYRFDFPTSPVEQSVVASTGVLPKIAGVSQRIIFT